MTGAMSRLASARSRASRLEAEHRAEMSAIHAEVADAIRALRAEGWSFADIGAALDPPVSRQRVFQMLAGGAA